jgi:hypothetical protein
MAAAKDPNYTPEQEAVIRAASEAGTLNLDAAKRIGAEIGKSPRSVIAKIVRMGLPYASKEPTTKDGQPVVSKANLVERIGEVVSGNLDGLEKAPKPALQALAAFVARSAEAE